MRKYELPLDLPHSDCTRAQVPSLITHIKEMMVASRIYVFFTLFGY